MSSHTFPPVSSSEAATPCPAPGADGAPVFFAVSMRKLLVMSLCSFGLYQIYWWYQNWKLVRARTGEKVSPALRTLFSVFFCYSLLKRIRNQRPDLPSGRLAAGPLTAAWTILSLLCKLPDPYWVIAFGAMLTLLPVQAAANTVNRAVAPGHDPNARLSRLNWATVVVGGALFVLVLIGAFVPDGDGTGTGSTPAAPRSSRLASLQ
jgi:hypothetical protein